MSSKQLLRRIGLGILTLWLVSLVVFAAVIALPGDAATAILGKEATPDRVAALREQLHLNQSVVTQYTEWLKGVVTGNFGDSAATQQPVSQLLSDRVANSAFLVIVASVIAIPLSIVIGVWMAMKRDRPADHVSSTITTPPAIHASSSAVTWMAGTIAFGTAWRQITCRSGSPFNRAIVTYSDSSTSTIEPRMMRLM